MKTRIITAVVAALLCGALAGQEEKKDGKTGVTFYGQTVVAKQIVFVIDVSSSMQMAAAWKPSGGGTAKPATPPPPANNQPPKGPGPGARPGMGPGAGGGIGPASTKKIDIAKDELKKVIQSLDANVSFSIIYFSDDIKIWKEELVAATDENKGDALQFVDALQAGSRTNVYDALMKALTMQKAKQEEVKKSGIAKGSAPDVIYLLTDGSPTAGKVTDARQIRQEIKDLNKSSKVKINTIAISELQTKNGQPKKVEDAAAKEFLKGLSDDSGGTFLER